MEYKSFEDSAVWQNAHGLVISLYELTRNYPKEELYALVSQIRRAAISVEANIAEGFGRYHYLDKLNFYYCSRGSIEEIKSHLITSRDLNYITSEDYRLIRNTLETLGRELNIIIGSLRSKKKDVRKGS